MIYLRLSGRIGNQLFMYSTARMIQLLKGDDDMIVVEDYGNSSPEGCLYENSLVYYPLENVKFVHDLSMWHGKGMLLNRIGRALIINLFERNKSNDDRYKMALKYQKLYNFFGIFHIQDGYVQFPKHFKKNIVLEGYFQSERFFSDNKDEIVKIFRIDEIFNNIDYPNGKIIEERNTVCISIKVQHNIGNYMYDVCHADYYQKAIDYIVSHVDNPLFFICSDDVNYVKEVLIDTSKYDVVCQAKEYPVHISLAAMARCKHFIIGNTSFGWWAQYLSTNPEKIVIVPDRWYNGQGNWQYDLYMDNWIRIKC